MPVNYFSVVVLSSCPQIGTTLFSLNGNHSQDLKFIIILPHLYLGCIFKSIGTGLRFYQETFHLRLSLSIKHWFVGDSSPSPVLFRYLIVLNTDLALKDFSRHFYYVDVLSPQPIGLQ